MNKDELKSSEDVFKKHQEEVKTDLRLTPSKYNFYDEIKTTEDKYGLTIEGSNGLSDDTRKILIGMYRLISENENSRDATRLLTKIDSILKYRFKHINLVQNNLNSIAKFERSHSKFLNNYKYSTSEVMAFSSSTMKSTFRLDDKYEVSNAIASSLFLLCNINKFDDKLKIRIMKLRNSIDAFLNYQPQFIDLVSDIENISMAFDVVSKIKLDKVRISNAIFDMILPDKNLDERIFTFISRFLEKSEIDEIKDIIMHDKVIKSEPIGSDEDLNWEFGDTDENMAFQWEV